MSNLTVHPRSLRGTDVSDLQDIFPPSPPMSADEEMDLGLRSMQGDDEARHRLVLQWCRYAVSRTLNSVRRRWWEGMDVEDCVWWGISGVVRGVRTFDPRKARLSTHLTMWIDVCLQRGMRAQRFIHLPNKLYSLWSAGTRDFLDDDSDAVWEDIAQRLRKGKKTIADATADALRDASSAAKRTETLRAVDPLTSSHSAFDALPTPESALSVEERMDVHAAIEKLSGRHREILERRYGFSGRAETLEEIGNSMSICRERVRQLLSTAHAKLRRILGGSSYVKA